MSANFAIWLGPKPASDEEATTIFERLSALEPAPPRPELIAYVDELLKQYPEDVPDSEIDDVPWAATPLRNEIVGNLFYCAISWSHYEEVATFMCDLADKHRLVAFDPQSNTLMN